MAAEAHRPVTDRHSKWNARIAPGHRASAQPMLGKRSQSLAGSTSREAVLDREEEIAAITATDSSAAAA